MKAGPVHIGLIEGEHSGDQLGFKLMQALRRARPDVVFSGVGGEAMVREGLPTLFPLTDIAVMGFVALIPHLPRLLARIRFAAQAIIANPPDVLVIIDSPDFTHRVAAKVRKALPNLPIVDYVSPTVLAWRPGRAKAMTRYVNHVLALLPFEPAAHQRLGGPACTYVGHPLIERFDELRGAGRDGVAPQQPPMLLVLPGSRRSEIEHLMEDFGAAVALVAQKAGPLDVVLPAVASLIAPIRAAAAKWSVPPRIIVGEAEKFAAFRTARAALAASGTVTLELALAGVPMVVAYKVPAIETLARFFITAPSFVLPNLILGENFIPEFIQSACTPQALATGLLPLLADSPARDTQLRKLQALDAVMRLPAGQTPSDLAADIILRATAIG